MSSSTGDERLNAFLDKLDYKGHAPATEAIDAALYAFAVTIKNPTDRRCFIQDFAAALGRRGLLTSDNTERFWQLAEDKVKNINCFQRLGLAEVITQI
jgi:hypothetical protein